MSCIGATQQYKKRNTQLVKINQMKNFVVSPYTEILLLAVTFKFNYAKDHICLFNISKS